MSADPAASQRIGSGARRLVALILLATSGALLWLATMLDWGLSPVAWVPALVLLPIAAHLWPIRDLRVVDGRLVIGRGDEAPSLPLAEITIEIAPLAGTRAVVAHHRDRPYPLALWVGRRRAEAIAAWLDAQAPHPLPRREHRPHRLDV